MIAKLFSRITSPELTVLVVNLLVAALWGLGLLLQKIGIPWLAPLSGTLVFLAPGFSLTFLLEQLAETKSKPIIWALWTALLSFILTPVAVYVISLFGFKQLPIDNVILPFLIWWAISSVITVIVSLIKRQPVNRNEWSFDRKTKRELLTILGGFTAIVTVNFILYPLLPEGDGYAYLVKWDEIRADPSLFTSETRGVFLVFVTIASQILQVDPYWIFKVLLPLSHITIILACYLFARNFITESRYLVLLSLSPLFFPIILQEMLISRPQSLFLIAFLPSIVIISEILNKKENIRQIYWLLTIVVIGVIGIKIHALFAILAFLGLVSITLLLWREIVKRPVDSFLIAMGIFLLLYPHLIKFRVIADVWHLIKLFAAYAKNSTFEFWFIDHYRNVDGIEAGWPGFSALFYYAYNVGLLFPILFIWSLVRKKIGTLRALFQTKYWAVVFLLGFFFFIAEIAPRFQLAYLPDRAWLFMALLFTLILPVFITALKKSGSRFFSAVTIASLVSISAGSGLTYAKQGWVTPDEVKAARFIRTQTPENAIFFGQGSTRVMIRYYGKREFTRPNDEAVFLTGEKSTLDNYIENTIEAPYRDVTEEVPRRRVELSRTLAELSRELVRSDLTNGRLEEIFAILNNILYQRGAYVMNTKVLRENFSVENRPIYLVYNQNKFKSLYGSRDWWRSSNFYGANLTRLNENYPVVYNQDGIIIWQARK